MHYMILSLCFRMKYGFVTYDQSRDAYAAIDNSKIDPEINTYDVNFGGRRAFCRSYYEDLGKVVSKCLFAFYFIFLCSFFLYLLMICDSLLYGNYL